MKDWIVIKSFDRIQQAQLRKALLEQNGIEAVVFSQKDSAFLLGSIDLYVKKKDFAKAKEVLTQFSGWAQINSFIRKPPLSLQEEILQRSEIETMLTEEYDAILNSTIYELFVKTDKAQKIIEKFNHLTDWTLITEHFRPKFIAYYFDILDKYEIKTLVLSQKNQDGFITNIQLYAENLNADFAQNLVAELRGWTVIHRPYSKEDAEKWIDFLEENKIPALYEYESESKNFYLYTPLEFEQEAIDLVNRNRDWKLVETYSDFYQAIMAKNVLAQQNIESIIMTKKDSVFLLGDIEIFVEEKNYEKAVEILQAAVNIRNEETGSA